MVVADDLLTPDDLTPYMQRRLEAAYERRTRLRCSKEDFVAGYLAALCDLSSTSSFRRSPDRQEAHPDVG
jgi:hypothetical protein